MAPEDHYSPFWTHVEELRRTLLRIFAIIVAGVLICFLFYAPLITFLTNPLKPWLPSTASNLQVERIEYTHLSNPHAFAQTYTLPENAIASLTASAGAEEISPHTYRLAPNSWLTFAKPITDTNNLVVLGPLEGMLTALKTSLWIGAVITSPLWLLVLLQFFLPALHSHEKRLIWPFLITSVCFIVIGCCFAFFVTIPIANTYLFSFNEAIGTNLWSLSHYLDYTLFLLLANGLAFEFCVVGIFAVHLNIITAEWLITQRRLAIVMAFIVGALLTPPDVLTQIMLAVPLMLMYEGLILYARFKGRM